MTKFKNEDNEYFEKRKLFADKYGVKDFWHIADNWQLYSGHVNIGRTLAIYELLKQTIDLPGNIIELGVWNGANLMFMAKVIRLLKPNSLIELYGFDSFEGLQKFQEKDSSAANFCDKYKGNEEILKEIIALYKFDDFVHLIKGDIEITLPEFLEKRHELMFSFIYFDTDLYNSTKKGIDLLLDRLLKGGIMVFDEYNVKEWPGETLAVKEAIGDKYRLQTINFARQPTAYFVKT